MADLAISRLSIKAAAGSAAGTRMRVEDALRIGADDDDRLLIVRRLRVRGLRPATGAAIWNHQVGELIADQRRTAPHASLAAADVPAVWFRSRAEAQALLLACLATGNVPAGWFWRLAVPDWQGEPLSSWLPRALTRAETDPHLLVMLGVTIVAALEAGSPALGNALALCPPPRALATGGRPEFAKALVAPAWALIRASPRLATLFLSTRRQMPTRPLRQWAAMALLLRQHPTITATPALLAGAVTSLVDRAPSALDLRDEEIAEATPDTASPSSTIEREKQSSLARRAERASAIAGTFLIVRALSQLGLGEWLDARPELLARGFGRTLLRHIAEHHRAEPDDPVLLLLTGDECEDFEPALRLWRIGLDRWLRRTARVPLHDIVRRPGHLLAEQDQVLVRFAIEAADIRLRRYALDTDPGWTPWLGLRVLYVYRDEPLG